MNTKLFTPVLFFALHSLSYATELTPQTTPPVTPITYVGNGDAGGDLEELRSVHQGRLIRTRDQALKRVRDLKLENISGLGSLIPELEQSPVMISEHSVPATLQQDTVEHTAQNGRVYARTLSEPRAATRFFPEALHLSDAMLQALHIHEALHRALPASHQQSDLVVSEITLAITGAHASNDRVRTTTERLLATSPEALEKESIKTRQAAPIEASQAVMAPQGVDDENWVMEKPNLFLVEGLGKGFLYSVGYERQVSPRVSLGVGFSVMSKQPEIKPVAAGLDGLGQAISNGLEIVMADTLSYVALPLYMHYAFMTGRHRPYVELGVTPMYFHRAHYWGIAPGVGGGYEFRTQTGFFARASIYLVSMLPAGIAGGPLFFPTGGLTLGWAF